MAATLSVSTSSNAVQLFDGNERCVQLRLELIANKQQGTDLVSTNCPMRQSASKMLTRQKGLGLYNLNRSKSAIDARF